jgi:hypothetical protein
MVNEFKGKCKLIKADCVMVEDDSLSKLKRAYQGVAYTHIQLIKDAFNRGDKTLLVFEDDCKLVDDSSWGKWLRVKQWCDNNMDKWEIFNAGLVRFLKVEDVIRYDEMFICKEVGGGGAHFLYFNVEKAYQKVLDWVIEKYPIDLYYSERFNYWVSYPVIAIQRNGHSDIQSNERSWDFMNEYTNSEGLRLIGDFLLFN